MTRRRSWKEREGEVIKRRRRRRSVCRIYDEAIGWGKIQSQRRSRRGDMGGGLEI